MIIGGISAKFVDKKHLIFRILILLCSIGLVTFVDTSAAHVIDLFAPHLKWVAWVRIPSLIVCAALFFATSPRSTYRLPRASDFNISVLKIALFWLVPAAYFVLIAKVWVPSLPRWIDIVAFMGTGLLAEELLFRGAIFQMVARVSNSSTTRFVSLPVLISATLFAIQHIQYHGFQLSAAAEIQIVYTLFMGIVFGLLREKTGSIWPPIFVHIINNSFTLWRAFF